MWLCVDVDTIQDVVSQLTCSHQLDAKQQGMT